MAVVSISKINIIGLKQDYDKIIERLIKRNCFEVNQKEFGISADDNSERINALAIKQARVDFAINYLNKQNNLYVSAKTKPQIGFDYEPFKMQSVRDIVSADKLFGIAEKEAELENIIEQINTISYKQTEILHNKQKIKENIDALKVYLPFLDKFSDIKDTASTFTRLFAGAGMKPPKYAENWLVQEYYGTKSKLILVTALNEEKENVLTAFGEAGFVTCPYCQDSTAEDCIREETQKDAELDNEGVVYMAEALKLAVHLDDLKLLYDYYNVMDERYSKKGSASTDYITAIEGWCPEYLAEDLCASLREEFVCVYCDISAPDENDVPPTLLKNNALVQPFEDLTAMYTVPAYRDKDPNMLMSFWFFLFFGMMIADVVYGALLVIGVALFLRFKKTEKGVANLAKLLGICGFSSIIWGLIFGSFMGFGIKVGNFPLSYQIIENGESVRYFGWFNTMEEPIKLLALAIVSGMAHLLFAFCIKAALLIKDKKPIAAICDAGFNITTIIAIALIGLNIFAYVFATGQLNLDAQYFNESTSAVLSGCGSVLLIVSIAGIFLLSGRAALIKAKIGGWLGAGINGLYGGLIGLVADILSYSRLFGLGLAGGAIAFAFNTLVKELFFGGNIIMAAIGGVLLLFLHVFNLGISLLGAYVHNARLQFLEYYGKFLTGDGRIFSPLGNRTKYTKMR